MYEIVINNKKNYPLSYDGFLFNEPEFIELQSSSQFYFFELLNHDTGYTEARFCFFVNGQVGMSPLRAPFGSIECNPELDEDLLDDFIERIESFALSLELKKITIKSYPICYAEKESLAVEKCLSKRSFEVAAESQTFFINIHDVGFEEIIAKSKQSRLKRSRELGLKVEILSNENLSEIYNFIADCRKDKAYPPPLELEILEKTLKAFPDRYVIFAAKDGKNIVGACLAIKVNKEILYAFYTHYSREYNKYAPTVILVEGIYQFCQREQFKILDLGVALDDEGILKESLLHFKERLGAKESGKRVYEKIL